jgi:hypothetical protein
MAIIMHQLAISIIVFTFLMTKDKKEEKESDLSRSPDNYGASFSHTISFMM